MSQEEPQVNNTTINMTNTQAIKALENIAMEGLKEQRRSRRWSIFFKFNRFFAVVFRNRTKRKQIGYG